MWKFLAELFFSDPFGGVFIGFVSLIALTVMGINQLVQGRRERREDSVRMAARQ